MAIVVTTLVALVCLGWVGSLPWSTVQALTGGGGLVALIGFVDDRRHIMPRWRLVGHFLAASWALLKLAGPPSLTGIGLVLQSGWLGLAIGIVYIVWMLNLTNFMDGIDGLAAVETVTVCIGAAVVSGLAKPGEQLWIAPLVLASGTLGFLMWNWPPAKIFMGDAGSGFLGFMLAGLSLHAGLVSIELFWSWVVLLGVFVVDATVTLARRVTSGERFYQAHRSHAYQHAAALRGTHTPVTVGVGLINTFWLLPLALAVAVGGLDGVVGVAIAYTPLIVAAVRLNAGRSNLDI